jgi:hypothetical protein
MPALNYKYKQLNLKRKITKDTGAVTWGQLGCKKNRQLTSEHSYRKMKKITLGYDQLLPP